jgi:hypothetical protein
LKTVPALVISVSRKRSIRPKNTSTAQGANVSCASTFMEKTRSPAEPN